MMDLLKRIAFEGNIRRSTILFYFAAKFGDLPHRQCSIIDELNFLTETEEMNRKSFMNVDWHRLRSEYRKLDSFVVYKWIRKMLLLIGNQNMFYGDDFEVAFNLQVSFHYFTTRSPGNHLPFAGDSFNVHRLDLFHSIDADIVTTDRYANEIRSNLTGVLSTI